MESSHHMRFELKKKIQMLKKQHSKHPNDQRKRKRNKKNITAAMMSRKMMKKWPTSSKD
jgi:hypothetical protein